MPPYLEQDRNQRGELSQIAVKHTSAHADQKDAYKASMQDMEEQFKAQFTVLDPMQHVTPGAQAPILEQQEANTRDELRCLPKD